MSPAVIEPRAEALPPSRLPLAIVIVTLSKALTLPVAMSRLSASKTVRLPPVTSATSEPTTVFTAESS